MAPQFPSERCRKYGVLLTCFIDGRKRFRPAPLEGLGDSSWGRVVRMPRDNWRAASDWIATPETLRYASGETHPRAAD